jgi:hypothetical protein
MRRLEGIQIHLIDAGLDRHLSQRLRLLLADAGFRLRTLTLKGQELHIPLNGFLCSKVVGRIVGGR